MPLTAPTLKQLVKMTGFAYASKASQALKTWLDLATTTIGTTTARADNGRQSVVKELVATIQTAGATNTGNFVWRAPTAGTITGAYIMPSATPDVAPAASPNNCVMLIAKVGGSTIATKTYNNVTTLPTAGAYDSLGALDATQKVLAAGDLVSFSCAANGNTDLKGTVFQFDFQPANV